tara:strand:+ start:2283 stop:3182 length:900 start_codon:yes stop_codon:yes gene_type:complete
MTWVAAGVAVVGGGIQVAQGIKQKRSGRELENSLNKPTYQIPSEIAKNMSEAEIRSYQGLPDEQKAAFLDNQQRASQTALRSSSDRRGGLGMISQIQANQDRSSLGLLQQDVTARDNNILRAQQARTVMASYKEKRFEHDYNEYSTDLDYARAQLGAGMQNVSGGLTTAASAIQTGMAYSEEGISRSDKKLHEQQNKETTIPPDNTLTDQVSNQNFINSETASNSLEGNQAQLYNFSLNDAGLDEGKKNILTKTMLKQANKGDMKALNWLSTNYKDSDNSLDLKALYKQHGVPYKMMKK